MILIDSNIIIDAMKGREGAITALKAHKEEGIAVSILSIYEVKMGIYCIAKKDPNFDLTRRMKKLDQLLHSFTKIPVDHRVVDRAAEIMGQLLVKGLRTDPIDILIGSSCLIFGIKTVFTENVKHFERIPNLQVIKAYEN